MRFIPKKISNLFNRNRTRQGSSIFGFLGDFDAEGIINSIIIRRVEPISFADFYILDKNNKDTDPIVKKSLEENFLDIYMKLSAIRLKKGFAVCIIERIGSSGFGRLFMPDDLEVIRDNRVGVSNGGMVIGAHYSGQFYELKDLIVLYDTHYLAFGRSRKDDCNNELKILGATASARYTTAKYRGALGMITRSSDEQIGLSEFDSEKQRIQDEYKLKYGITEGQNQIIITNQNLKWVSMTYPTSTLGLSDAKKESIEMICVMFGIKPELIVGGATFSNSEQAELSLLINLIIPNAKKDMQEFKNKLKIKGMPTLDFTENPIYKNYSATADKATIELLNTMYENGAIDKDEYRANMQKFIDLENTKITFR